MVLETVYAENVSVTQTNHSADQRVKNAGYVYTITVLSAYSKKKSHSPCGEGSESHPCPNLFLPKHPFCLQNQALHPFTY